MIVSNFQREWALGHDPAMKTISSGGNGLAINTFWHGLNGSKHTTNILGDNPAPICHGPAGRFQGRGLFSHRNFAFTVNMRYGHVRTHHGLLLMISSVIHVPHDIPRPLALIHTTQTSVRLHQHSLGWRRCCMCRIQVGCSLLQIKRVRCAEATATGIE